MSEVSSASDVLQIYTALQECASVSACGSLFRSAIAPFGLAALACGEVDLSDRDRNVLFLAEWPEDWRRYYAESGFIERDPILNALSLYRGTFTFGDIIRDRRFFARPEREAFRVGAEQGWGRGMAVALPRGGNCFGLVTLLGRGGEFGADERVYLRLISECLLARVRALGERVTYVLPPAGLSKREIEAARLVSHGLSDSEIAVALGISYSTAHKHVEAARRRLKAANRAHMGALCVAMGIATAG